MKKILKRTAIAMKKSLSIVLAFSMMISVCVISAVSVSADTSTIDVYYENIDSWSTVYAYVWSSSTGEKEFGEWPGKELSYVSGNTWEISVPTTMDMVIFNNGEGEQTGNINLPDATGYIYNDGEWAVYSSVDGAVQYEYTAKTGSSFSSVDYVASCSYYDYLDDNEISTATWGNVEVAGNSATWYPFDTFNSALNTYYKNNSVKKPLYFGNLNTGTMSDEDQGRRDTYYNKTNGLYNYDAAPNNSKAVYYDSINWNITDIGTLAGYDDPPSYAYSYQGVVSNTLKNGNLQMMKTDNSNTVDAPFFNDTFLQTSSGSTIIGRKVNSVLPFVYNSSTKKYSYQSSTNETHSSPINGIYLSNSKSGSSTNNLSGVTSDSLTMNYGGSNTNYAIKDGKLWFNSGDSGYGFFPFNNNTINHTSGDVRNDLNYGFGMALTVDFTVPTNGYVQGTSTPVTFKFTGDDDVWIFIDDKLVVDLGGDHKDASCTLNFASNTVTYSTGLNQKAVTTSSNEYSLASVMSGSTGNTVHTLKMFYMERGLIESNLQVEFSFSPIDNYLTTEKVLNTADVNTGLKTALTATDSFEIKNVSNGTSNTGSTVLGSKSYVHTNSSGTETSLTTDSNGKYTLKGSESAAFTNIADVGNYLTVSESTDNSLYDYTTTYSVKDIQNNKDIITTTTGPSANFLFKNGVDEKKVTNYKVTFTNTPKVGDLSVTKEAFDIDGKTKITGEDFNFTILIDLDQNGTYETYNLDYTVNSTSKTATNGVFTLQGDQTATFKGIPIGAKYQIIEANNADYTTEPSNRTITGVVSGTASENSVTFQNTKIDKSSASVDLKAVKLVDGTTPDVNTFEFSLTELTLNGTAFTEGEVIQKVKNFEKKIEFDSIVYPYEEATTAAPTTLPPTTVAPTTVAPTTVAPTTEPVTTVPSENYIYYKNTNSWSTVNAYYWSDSNTKMTSWPGVAMTSIGDNVYRIEVPSDAQYIIFNNGSAQTDDITLQGMNMIYNNGSWSAYASTYSLRSVNMVTLTASSAEKHYYKISENAVANDNVYEYDSTVYYVVVTVNRSTTPITASAAYYKTAEDAIKETNQITSPDTDVVFRNFHKGSIEITKQAKDPLGNTSPITDEVVFSLYKTDKEGGELISLVESKEVDPNGKVKFENLEIFVDQHTNKSSSVHQWYCYVETNAATGYNINSTKFYFTVPYSKQSSSTGNFTTNGVNYEYVLGDDNKPVYHITGETVDNYLLVTPAASGTGISMFVKVGLGIIGTGAVLFASYTAYDRVQRRKRKARHTATRH